MANLLFHWAHKPVNLLLETLSVLRRDWPSHIIYQSAIIPP